MKKIFTILFLGLISIGSTHLYAQQARMVLWEQFTNTGCGPCASFNPTAEAYWAANPDKVVPISYHVNWPSSNDPMYLNNTAENNWRRTFYGCNSVPWSTLNGNVFNQNPDGINTMANHVNAEAAKSPKFNVTLEHELNADKTEVTVNVTVTANEDMSGNFLTHIVILEKEINLSSPGPNGETHFVNVMKKFLPNQNGNPLPASIAAGESFNFSQTWTIEGFYDIINLCAAAFVQNTADKYIYQAAFSSPIPPAYNDVVATAFKAPSKLYCGNGLIPVLTITNKGANLSSVDVEYSINGNAPISYHATEVVHFLGSSDIELPYVSEDFLQLGENTISATLSNPNDGEDENPENNSIEMTFEMINVDAPVVVEIFTGSYAEELSWELLDFNGNIITSRDYDENDSQQTFRDTLNFPVTGCYSMLWHDSYGDGFNGGGKCTLFTYTGEQFAFSNGFTDEMGLYWHAEGDIQLNTPNNFNAYIISNTTIGFEWEVPTHKTTLLGYKIWSGANAETPINNELIAADLSNYEYNPSTYEHFNFYLSAVYQEGESAKAGPIGVDFFEGIADNINTTELSIYPNPSKNTLNIQFNLANRAQVEVNVIDITGKLVKTVFSKTLSSGEQLLSTAVQHLNKGVYFIELKINNSRQLQKFVKL